VQIMKIEYQSTRNSTKISIWMKQKNLRGESIENQFVTNIERVMEKHLGKTNISFFSDFEYDLPCDDLKKKISRLK